MKERLQGVIVGVLIGTTLTGGAAIAANTTTLYDVVTSGVKIVVDGKKIHPTDAQGNKVEPMIYNGTTYLPVRAVADALGKAVYWDGPNYTVYLGQAPNPGELPYPTVRLEDMTSIGDDVSATDSLTDNYGNTYEHAIYNTYMRTNYEYLLNMKYSRFKGVLYIPEGQKDDESVHLSIIADGKTIYTSPQMTKASGPVKIDVDIRGCNNLKIEYSKGLNSGYHGLWLCLGNAGFYQ